MHGTLEPTVHCSLEVMSLKKRVNLVLRHARRLQRLHEQSVFLYAVVQALYPVYDAPESLVERP